MPDSAATHNATPSPASKSSSWQRLVTWGIRLALALLILITLYLSAGRLLMPRISSQRPVVEAELTRLLGVEVSIASLEGSWFRFTPQVRIGTLVLRPDGAAPQSISGLGFSVDLWKSLLDRQLAIRAISIDALDLMVEQDVNGRWSLAGMTSGQGNYSTQILDFLLQTPNLQLLESNLLVRPFQQPSVALRSVLLYIQNAGNNHKLQLQFRVENQASPNRVLVNLDGWPDSGYSGQAWLTMPDLDVKPLLAAVTGDWQVDQAQVSSSLWVHFSSDGEVQLRGQAVNANAVASLANTDRQINLTNTGFDLYAALAPAGAWQLQVSNLSLDWQNTPWEVPMLFVERPAGDAPLVTLRAPVIDLAMIGSMVLDAAPIPDAGLEALRTLDPRGELVNLVADTALDGSMPGGFHLRGNLRQIAVDPWNAAPGGSGLDGYLELNGVNGFVEVDSNNLNISLPLLFASPWHYDHVNSRVSWEVSEGRVHAYSTMIDVDSSDLQGRVAFDVLNTRDPENNQETRFTLQVGVARMDVLQGKVYLPSVPQVANLMDWLRSSLQGGQLHDSAFLYRSNSRNGVEISSAAGSWYQAEAGELQFLPDWPALEDISATVVVRNNNVEVLSDRGTIGGIPVNSARAWVKPEAQGSLVTVTADAGTDTANGLRFLLESPLHDSFGTIFDTWQPTGRLGISLNLQVPVGDNPVPQQIAVDVHSLGSTLVIPEYSLQFDNVLGQVRYTTDGGLQARDLSASLFDFPIVASIDSQTTGATHLTRVTGEGHARVDALSDWAGQPLFVSRLLENTSGEIDYQLQLDFPGEVKADGTSTLLQLQSNLLGVTSTLPEPFTKSADESRPLVLEYGFSETGNADLLALRYANLFSGQLVLDARGINRGQLDFGDRNRTFTMRQSDTSAEGVLVSGDLTEVDYDAWEAVALSLVSDDETARSLKEAIRLVDVNVQAFSVRGEQFEDINVQVQPEPEAWLITAHNTMLSGMLRIPDNEAPWVANLEYLRFPAIPERTPEEAAAAEAEDLLEEVDPTQLPAFDFRTAELSIGDSDLGELRFELQPSDFGAQIRHFWLLDDEARISDQAEQEGANLDWEYRNGFHSSRFTGVLVTGDLARVMPEWGHDAFIESRSALFSGSLGWPGSPLAFSVKRSSGQLDLDIREGRFVDIDSGSSRIFGVFNFDALIRRLQLDFSDLFQRGFAYDRITGDLGLSNGVIATNDSLVIDGPSSRLRINGEINLPEETIAADMLVRIPLGQNISLLAGLLGAWPIALSTYVASKIFAEQVDEFTTLVYRLEGPWSNVDAGFEAPVTE